MLRTSLACALLAAAFLAASALLLGCGGGGGSTDIEPSLRFADRTDAEISRLVAAASGSEGFQAQASISAFDESFDPDPCPAVSIAGSTVTIVGGCTTRDGATIEGTASITNPIGWGDDEIEYDYTEDTTYILEQFAIVQANQRRAFDGIFSIRSSYTEMDMDITSELLAVAVRSDIFLDCSRTSCSLSGSGVELVGVGGATVSGSIAVAGNQASASFTLKGADTVKVTVENNCTSWKLEGTDRAFNPCQ